MERTISFTLNGKPARVAMDDERMLLWVLRGDLGLTGHEVRLRRGSVRRLHGHRGQAGRAVLLHDRSRMWPASRCSPSRG